MNKFEMITRRASKTFWLATRLFPGKVRDDVYILYAYVRTADDYVDKRTPEIGKLIQYREQTKMAFSGKESGNELVDQFAAMAKRRKISRKWIWDFFAVQKQDAGQKRYRNWDELLGFTYGVAEVVGLCMCRIMELPQEAYYPARLLGRAMQLVNILRDIAEDEKLGKVYLPEEDLNRFGVKNPGIWSEEERDKLGDLIRWEVMRVREILDEAEEGLKMIPVKNRLAVGVVADLYRQTLTDIDRRPERIYREKIRPGLVRIGITMVKNHLERARKTGKYAL